MIKQEYEYGFGVDWRDICVYRRQGFYTSVSDFHEHGFYEINLVLSGNIKVLLPNRVEGGSENRIILTAPHTPHYIACSSEQLYSRTYLLFSHDFIAGAVPEWRELIGVFGTDGNTLLLSEEQTAFCADLIERIERDPELFRRKMLVLYLLSYVGALAKEQRVEPQAPPQYVMEALSYVEEHYAQRIVASELAHRFYIGRTALLTAFKRYTGVTLNHYVRACRLRHARRLLLQGLTVEEIAERCGFCDAGCLIKVFKQEYGVTPKQYLRETREPLS